jgi:hypothetical protein
MTKRYLRAGLHTPLLVLANFLPIFDACNEQQLAFARRNFYAVHKGISHQFRTA